VDEEEGSRRLGERSEDEKGWTEVEGGRRWELGGGRLEGRKEVEDWLEAED